MSSRWKRTPRPCTKCEREFMAYGRKKRCPDCSPRRRTCTKCPREYTGINALCPRCNTPKRRPAARVARKITPAPVPAPAPVRAPAPVAAPVPAPRGRTRAERVAQALAAGVLPELKGDRRLARKILAQVDGRPVSSEAYAAIRDSGSCVYCAAPATTVDHVVPLARGGREHPDNLVPACGPCNFSKSGRLLTEWDADRMAHAIRVSPKVAALAHSTERTH